MFSKGMGKLCQDHVLRVDPSGSHIELDFQKLTAKRKGIEGKDFARYNFLTFNIILTLSDQNGSWSMKRPKVA